MKITDELLRRYVSGECTPEEAAAVELWMPDDEDINEKFLSGMLESEEEIMWNEISANLKFKSGISEKKVVPFYRKFKVYAAAACFLLALVSTILYINSYSESTLEKVSEVPSIRIELCSRDHNMVRVNIEQWRQDNPQAIQIINTSSKIKKVICGRGTKNIFPIKPGVKYVLKGTYENPCIVVV